MLRPLLMLAPLAACALVMSCSAEESASSSNGGAGGLPSTAQGGAASGGVAQGGAGGVARSGGTSGVAAGGAANGGVLGTGGATAKGGAPSIGGTAGSNGGSLATSGTGGTPTGGASNGGTADGGASGAGVSGAGASSGGAASGGPGAANSGGEAGGSAGSGSPAVRIVGRTAPGASDSVRFSWPGVNIHARFTGTQVSMNVNDGNNENRFTVQIDDDTPTTVTTAQGQPSLQLATGLSNGTHDLVIWRNTEASMGISEFSGLSNFGDGGALMAPAPAPDRRIEVIGDSLSVGAGDEGTSTTCNPSIDAFTNNYLAYGSVAARSVNADVVMIAWSGIGVYRSYSASDPTMPDRYDSSVPSDSGNWDFSKFVPHVVVINLGTNDFGAGNPGQAYVDAYVEFAQYVRSKYANAGFILIDMYGGDRQTAINSVVTALHDAGDAKVEMLSLSSVPNNNTACNQHPNVTAHAAMGNILSTRIKALMGW